MILNEIRQRQLARDQERALRQQDRLQQWQYQRVQQPVWLQQLSGQQQQQQAAQQQPLWQAQQQQPALTDSWVVRNRDLYQTQEAPPPQATWRAQAPTNPTTTVTALPATLGAPVQGPGRVIPSLAAVTQPLAPQLDSAVTQPLAPQQQQQQQQQPAAAVPRPGRRAEKPAATGSAPPPAQCRFSDAPTKGTSGLKQSYGLAMVQGDKLGALPTDKSGSSSPAAPFGQDRDRNQRSGVLVCLVSSGLDASSLVLSGSSMFGCQQEHPLDPGGCKLPWDKDATGQGTHLASIIAGAGIGPGQLKDRPRLGVAPGAELYSVRVWNTTASSSGGTGDGEHASNWLTAYTACEGRLRGLQASNLNRSKYRMVMLLDIQAKQPGPAIKAEGIAHELYPSEQEFINAAADWRDDILWVAPAGDAGTKAYPAALTASKDRLLSVGAVDCAGNRWPAAAPGAPGTAPRVDLLAPGVGIVGAVPAARAAAALTLGGAAVELAVAVAGDAAGQPAGSVRLVDCTGDECPRGGGGGAKALCVLRVTRDDFASALCSSLKGGGCKGGVVLVHESASPGASVDLSRVPLPSEDDVKDEVDQCAYRFEATGITSGPKSQPPLMLAPKEAGNKIVGLMKSARAATGQLVVTPSKQTERTGTPQAAAWVAGGAARLMARYPMCNASDVAQALISTASILGADGAPVVGADGAPARGRGGLVQLADAEEALSKRDCASPKAPPLP